MQCPSKSNQNWKPSATKQFQKRPKKNACVLSLLYTIIYICIQYSIVVPSGTLAMYDIVCHSHSLLFLQYQYYNTTQIQLHQMVKGRRCSGLNKEAMYAVSFHWASDLHCNYAPRKIDLRCVYNICNAAAFNWCIEAAHVVSKCIIWNLPWA